MTLKRTPLMSVIKHSALISVRETAFFSNNMHPCCHKHLFSAVDLQPKVKLAMILIDFNLKHEFS